MPKYNNPRKTWQYSTEFKVRAVKMSYQPDIKSSQVAEGLGIHPFMLSRWRKEYREGHLQGDGKRRVGLSKKRKVKSAKQITENAQLKKEIDRLKRENDLPKKVATVSGGSTSERFGFIHRYGKEIGVRNLCRWMQVSPSGYYAWRQRGTTDRALSDQQLLKQITKIFDDSHGRYGSPRVYESLRQSGYRIAKKRVERLMREAGLKARVTKVTRRMPGLKRFIAKGENRLLARDAATAPDQVWVADVTYIKLQRKWTYLATIMDQYSRRILGWSLSYSRTTELTTTALRYVIKKGRNPKNVIFHTDRGVEFTGSVFQSELVKYGMHHSVNRPGHCTDNAFMESFYHSLKGELIRQTYFKGIEELRSELSRYINKFYNTVRLHSGIGYMSPINYEQMAA
ncbi:IS3 family transposase [Reinekea marina]|nr:IS3 family transposase [Reinekea marina]MDN3650811.1 IS3 family transposase [Reinekea marina]